MGRTVEASPCTGLDETALVGEHHGLDPITQLQLGEDASDMFLHGRLAQEERGGDLGIGPPLGDQAVSEGCVEAYIRPYLADHGGIPADAPGGFAIFDDVALVMLLVGLICLGIAVIRARVLGWWVGALFIASPLLSFVGLSEPFALISDYLAFVAIFTIGVKAVRLSGSPTARALATEAVMPAAV